MTDNTSSHVAVVIGRWQFPHHGHLTLINKAFSIAPRVIIVIGSAYHSRDPRNPFTWEERQEMLLAALSIEQRSRVAFVPVRDYYDDERWESAVIDRVGQLIEHSTRVTLVGHKKDQTSEYLDQFSGWDKCEVTPVIDICSTALREVYFNDADEVESALAVIKPYAPAGVRHYLRGWARLPYFKRMVEETLAVRAYKQKYSAPYYLTADAVVRAGGKVLLVRRGGSVGHGLYALPGGHLNKNERFYQAAVRELAEETGVKLLPEQMRFAFKDAQDFDHPLRSPRGRLVTKAHYFDFKDREPFETQAGDDADQTLWVAIEDLLELEAQLFEDHAVALDRFLHIFPAREPIPKGAYVSWRTAEGEKACA